jgi:hypothetical protein
MCPISTPTTAMTTVLPEPELAGARLALLSAARDDLGAAMTLAVPFVLTHPAAAAVLSELSAIAGPSRSDTELFRARVGELIRAATWDEDGSPCCQPVVRSSEEDDPMRTTTPENPSPSCRPKR